MREEDLSDARLRELLTLAETATPRPWCVRRLDDDHAMNMVAISTKPDTGKGERWPEYDSGEIVAATLVQQPRYVDVADQRWEENARYITEAANLLPALIEEVLELRRRLASKTSVDSVS